MITATGIAGPTVVPLKLGQRVRYHHACGEMRKGSNGVWFPVGKSHPPRDVFDWEGKWVRVGDESGPFVEIVQTDTGRPYSTGDTQLNKSVAIWPQTGEGVLIGLIRKGIGISESPRGSTSLFDDSFEPGGFYAAQWVWMYVVKHSLSGIDRDLTFVPLDAATPIGRRR